MPAGEDEAVDDASTSPDWTRYFGFAEPYENQGDAIERVIDAGERGGYLAMEGPCGTGKTMAVLTAAATLLRETDDYERLLVVTPVKQQLRQFVADLRTLNAGMDDPLDGVALVGKRDCCPLDRAGLFPDDAGVHDRCEDLREATAGLIEAGESDPRAAAAEAVIGGESDDDQWWDPEIAADLAAAARPDGRDQRTLDESCLSADGATSPYRDTQPSAPPELGDGDEPLYCPFEADWYARNRGSPVDFDVGRERVVTVEEFLPAATERGTCPHRVMSVMLANADVVVGNYNHLFDPQSRPLLTQILDEDTFVVVDEAHRIEERVRDLLSDRLGRHTLVRARNDCGQLVRHASQTRDHRRQVADVLAARDVSLEAVERARDFLDDAMTWLDERVERFLDGEHGGWRASLEDLPDHDREIPLRDPEMAEPDEFTRWMEDRGYEGADWRSLAAVGAAVEDALGELDLARTPVCAAAGAILGNWWERDHATYFREVELGATDADERHVDADYEAAYTASLLCYNCMPAAALEDIFDDLGGGVLMSATLEPLDVFRRVTGLDALSEGDADVAAGDAAGAAEATDVAHATAGDDESAPSSPSSAEETGRPVETVTYDLPFPESNRASWIVDCRPFTARNRGDPATMEPLGTEWNRTRDEYAHALRAIARSPGNVMIAMPNYREAAWAGAYLEEAVDAPVFVDESSSSEATDDLRDAFVAAGDGVIVTSTRGTLTEGVDYPEEDLQTCAVVGVPLVNVGSPQVRAVRRAYGAAFGEDHAFEYALTVPAVRRARQAIGRVIRGTEEVGVRALVGKRYVPDARHSVYEYLPTEERAEFSRLTPPFLADEIESFWASH